MLDAVILLIAWLALSHRIAYDGFTWLAGFAILFLILMTWELVNLIDPHRQAPEITGREDSSALISIVCPHCDQKEWRIQGGKNWCEVTGGLFYIKVIAYDWENDGR